MAEQRNRRGVRSGISVIESVIAVTIVVTIMSVVCPVVIQAQYSVRRGRDHYVAASLGMAMIEQARKQDYALLTKMAESQHIINDFGNYDSAGRFRRTVTVRTNSPSVGVTEVLVDIDIRDRKRGVFRGETEHVATIFTTYLKAW